MSAIIFVMEIKIVNCDFVYYIHIALLYVFVGKAEVLYKELMKHFDCYGQKRQEIREIDNELCHHTNSQGWTVS